MSESSFFKLLGQLKPHDLVLDVGGWACPFNRASYVLYSEPFKTREFCKTVDMTGFQV